MMNDLYVTCTICGQEVKAQNALAIVLSEKHGYKCRECRVGRVWCKDNYQEYLKTLHWQHRRQRALKKALYRCQICSSTDRLEVHHNTYIRLGDELDSDLFVVCNHHHHMIHGRLTFEEYLSGATNYAELAY